MLAIAALITFLFLNSRFEGPDPTEVLREPVRADREVREHEEAARPSSRCSTRASRSGGSTRSSWDPEEQVGGRHLHARRRLRDPRGRGAADRRAQPARRPVPERRHARLGAPRPSSRRATRWPRPSRASTSTRRSTSSTRRAARRVKSLHRHRRPRAPAPAGNGAALNGTVGGAAQDDRESERADPLALRRPGGADRRARLRARAPCSTEIGTPRGRRAHDRRVGPDDARRARVRTRPRSTRRSRSCRGCSTPAARSLAEAEPLIAEARPLVARAAPARARPDPRLRRVRAVGGRRRPGVGPRSSTGLVPLRQAAEPVLGKAAPLIEEPRRPRRGAVLRSHATWFRHSST